ncbi:MAG: hypothetical protein FWF17_01685 [Betaproteobacteria bacterium]|nr:hypothetical protein [Betaproteobacteria bacterium]
MTAIADIAAFFRGQFLDGSGVQIIDLVPVGADRRMTAQTVVFQRIANLWLRR